MLYAYLAPFFSLTDCLTLQNVTKNLMLAKYCEYYCITLYVLHCHCLQVYVCVCSPHSPSLSSSLKTPSKRQKRQKNNTKQSTASTKLFSSSMHKKLCLSSPSLHHFQCNLCVYVSAAVCISLSHHLSLQSLSVCIRRWCISLSLSHLFIAFCVCVCVVCMYVSE